MLVKTSVTTIGDECSRVDIEIGTISKRTANSGEKISKLEDIVWEDIFMKCNQCGKTIPQTNTHSINFNGIHMIVCGKHYSQYVRYGKFLDESPKSCFDSNEYEIIQDKVWIYCFNRKNEVSAKFCIDLEDLEKVIAHKWRFWKGRIFTGNYKPISITSFLLNLPEGKVIDHIDNNPLNNCKSNLRIVTQAQNRLNNSVPKNNTSGVTGVQWDKERKKWAVDIRMNGTRCHLGRWENINDAVYARYYAENKLFKEFRSKSNDKKIIPYIVDCNNKKKIEYYVNQKLHMKFKNI